MQYKYKRWLTFGLSPIPLFSSLLHRWVSGCSDCPQGNDTGLFCLLQIPLRYDSDGEAGRPEAWVHTVWGPQEVGTRRKSSSDPSETKPRFVCCGACVDGSRRCCWGPWGLSDKLARLCLECLCIDRPKEMFKRAMRVAFECKRFYGKH